MRWPWQKEPREENSVSWDTDATEGFDPEQPADAGEAEVAAPPSLDDFEDEAVRGQVERLLAAREAEQEARLAEIGLGFGRDGRPMVADTGKVTGWLGPLSAHGTAGAGDRTPPPIAPPPAAAAAPEPEEDLDFYSMTTAQFNALVEKRAEKIVEKIVKPLQESLSQQQQWAQQRAARDGLAQMKDDLARYAPHINPEIVDHPDFPEFFRTNAANFPHHFLDDPQGRVAIAGMTSAFLDPNKQPRPRDDKGRFAGGQSAAEALVNRQFLAANAPSQGGRSQAAMGVTVSREDEAFLRGMERHTGTMSSAELSALEYTDIENYRRAMSKGQQRGRR